MRKMNISFLKKAVSLGLVATMVMSLAACGDDDNKKKSDKSYTYNAYMEASPLCWNPHTWQTNADNTFAAYCEMGFVDITMGKDGAYEWVFEMADSIEDITKDFADKEKWGIGADETKRVWQIKLNKDAKWDDGTKINADSYVTSMKYLLDPTMKNYRANLYYDPSQTESAVLGALAYYESDKAGQKKYATIDDPTTVAEGTKVYFNYNETSAFFGDGSAAEYAAAGYAEYMGDVLPTYDGKGYVEVTDDLKQALIAATAAFGDPVEEDWMQFCFLEDGVYEAGKWEDVGFYKVDDYTLIYITALPTEQFDMFVNLSSNFLVKEDVYEKGKTQTDKLVSTDYGTSVETYPSYGPYKLTSFEKDKMFVMEKNPNWYGYSDGKHKGQFQTTKIAIQVVPEHSTALQLFLSGKIDEIELEADDIPTYRMSDYLYKYDESYTFRWIFATKLDSLKALEIEANDGANKRLLAYDEFRKAISLAMDRSKFCAEATPGYSPAYYLINYSYYTDIANNPNSQYRYTKEAMEAVLNLYGIKYGEGEKYATVEEAYKSVTGYDKEEAKKLFTQAVEKAIADGNYTEGQEVKINCMATASASLSATDIAQQDTLNAMIADATVGTPLEGKVTITFKCGAEARYDDVVAGKVEMIRGAWGGATMRPFATIGSYTMPAAVGGLEKIHESNGWNPTTEKLEVTYDFDKDGTAETVSDTFENWTIRLNSEFVTDIETRTFLLAAIETGVLNAYRCIPWGSQTISSLLSQKLNYGSEEYNPMYAFGGIRLMTYNYDDAAWEKYVKEQGELEY